MSLTSLTRPLLAIIALSFSGICFAQTFSCPDKTESSSALVDDYPEWKAFADTRPHQFNRISLTAGPPEQEAFLVPDTSTKMQIGWNLNAGQQYWAVCHYLSSSIRLVQQLPANLKQCSVRFIPVGGKATQQDHRLVCK